MVLESETHNVLKMAVVDVRIDPKQALENDFDDGHEVLGEGDAYLKSSTDLAGEEGVVVDLALDPGHQIVDVLAGADLQGLLDALAVGPQILVPDKLKYFGPADITGHVSGLQYST